MKKLKATLAVLLAAASVLSLSGCAEDVAPTGGNTGGDALSTSGSTAKITSVTTSTFAENEAVNEAVKDIDLTALDNPDLKVSERIEWMAWWDIDETTPAAILFKEVYGIPETGKYTECDGEIFDWTYVSYTDRFTKLATAISSDSAPDLFPYEIYDFPYGVLQGRYNPISDIIDVENNPKWNGARELMEQFKFGDDYYVAFYETDINDVMYYKKSNIEAIGAEDPRELFDRDEWTWDTFLEIARKWQDSGDKKWAIDGYNPENSFVIATGVPMVGNNGVSLVNNLHNPSVERAEELLTTLQQENLRYPRHEENGWNINLKAWANDQILFYGDGGAWVFEDKTKLQNYHTSMGWAQDEITCVPFPRDPQADAYYVLAKPEATMWVKGSDNPNGVAAWLDCQVTASQDPAVKEAAKQQRKENYGWTDYNLDAYYEWISLDNDTFTYIIDFKGGLGSVSDTSSTENPVQSLTNLVYLTGEKTYTQLRAEHEPAIQAAIDEINEALANM